MFAEEEMSVHPFQTSKKANHQARSNLKSLSSLIQLSRLDREAATCIFRRKKVRPGLMTLQACTTLPIGVYRNGGGGGLRGL